MTKVQTQVFQLSMKSIQYDMHYYYIISLQF